MDIISALAGIPLPTLVALAAVVIIGLPHGALDGAIAIHLGMSRNLLSLTRFLVLYIAAAAAVVGAWMMAPVACLLVFLVISMLHFGMGDVRAGNGWQGMLEALAHGGLVVAGISQMHRDEVDVIFGYLVDGNTLLVWQGLEIISIFVAVALAVLCGAGCHKPQMEGRSGRTCDHGRNLCVHAATSWFCHLFLPCTYTAPCPVDPGQRFQRRVAPADGITGSPVHRCQLGGRRIGILAASWC
jgi:Brp/Blh family beta-carotene 15,15'-monooxygenase